MKKALLATAALAAATLAVPAMAAPAKDMQRVAYTCADNQVLNVVYINAGRNAYAVMQYANELVPMKITRAASGANYKAIDKNYSFELQTKGKSATLVEAGNKPVLSSCRAA